MPGAFHLPTLVVLVVVVTAPLGLDLDPGYIDWIYFLFQTCPMTQPREVVSISGSNLEKYVMCM